MNELRGLPVVKNICADLSARIDSLKEKKVTPKLSIVRVGANPDDLSYEKGILKRFDSVGALTDIIELSPTVTQEELERTILTLNEDASVHGILLFRPLPKHLSEKKISELISIEKDVDCMSELNLAGVFSGKKDSFPPCTPQAVIELLEDYQIDLTGKNVVIIGRSVVVGKPLAMLMLGKNATVTICHTKTKNLEEICKKADILVACAGVAKMVTADYVTPSQIVIDVGINFADGKLCGDVDYEQVAENVAGITPVPGGIGTITSTVILKHTVRSAEASTK